MIIASKEETHLGTILASKFLAKCFDISVGVIFVFSEIGLWQEIILLNIIEPAHEIMVLIT